MASSRWLVFCLLGGAALAHAKIDCSAPKLEANLSAHLREYAEECTKIAVENRLKGWKLPATEAKDKQQAGLIVQKMAPAWQQVAADLEALSTRTPAAGSMPPRLKAVLDRIARRAQATAADIAMAAEGKAYADVASFGAVAWAIPAKGLFLPEVKRKSLADLPEVEIDTELQPLCAKPAAEACRAALEFGRELMLHWKAAESLGALASDATIAAIARQIGANEELWKRYLYESKPMLPLDFVLTDWLTGGWTRSDQYPDGFREPPKTQWFLAHPSVGVEYASAAGDGQQLKPILYLEVIGANRWNERDRIDVAGLRYFSGVSLIVSYADRAGVKDTGYGALFTFDNVYSIGITRYGSETGVLLSLDLANLVRDKYKPKYEKYKDKLETLQLR